MVEPIIGLEVTELTHLTDRSSLVIGRAASSSRFLGVIGARCVMSPRTLGWLGRTVAIAVVLAAMIAPLAGAATLPMGPGSPSGGGSYILEPPVGGPGTGGGGGNDGGDPDDFANFVDDAPAPTAVGVAPVEKGAKLAAAGRTPVWYTLIIWLGIMR